MPEKVPTMPEKVLTMPERPPTTEDPRVGRTREVVRHAVVAELADVGYGALTIEGVARRAGVGKSTIYRHWADKVDLIADTFEHAHHEMVPDLGSATPREQVTRLLAHVAEVVADSPFSRCIPALIEGAERDRRLSAFHHRYSAVRRGELATAVATGVATGAFDRSVDPEEAAVALLGVLFYRRLMTASPFSPAEAPALVDRLLPPPEAGRRPSAPSDSATSG